MSSRVLASLTEVLATLHRPAGVLELRLNTPADLNSFGPKKCCPIGFDDELIEGLDYAKGQKDVKAVVISSTGRFFSSGASLNKGRLGDQKSIMPADKNAARDYVDALIDFPKLIAVSLQGPAYGIAVTTLPLFDLLYAAPETTLTTPFSRIGICLEGCSSVTFPQLFGPSMSSRILYLAQTVPIAELAYTGAFKIVEGDRDEMGDKVVAEVAALLEGNAAGSITTSKSLVRSPETRKHLHDVNRRDMAAVAIRVQSTEHHEAVAKFQAAKAAARKAREQSKL